MSHIIMRTGLAHQDARGAFDRARRRASWAKLAGWLHGHPASRNRLAVLGEVRTIAGAAGPGVRRLEYERAGHLGPTTEALVPIDQIVGTVEPTRFFDRHFRPTSEVPRTRFERIAADILSDRGMDPVDLYRCGGQYYVLIESLHGIRGFGHEASLSRLVVTGCQYFIQQALIEFGPVP
jgi:hypothetical protein